MKLIIGLGNPGKEYAMNRHNVGFMALDVVRADYNLPDWKVKFQSHISEGTVDGQKVLLLKPQTYMNESGRAVGEAARFYKIDAADIVVFHDELDLPPGQLRAKQGGGAAGHNGLKSIDAHLGTQNYKRIRIGIGHPGDKNLVSPYVLSNFAKADEGWLSDALYAMSKHFPYLVAEESDTYMTRIAEDLKK